MPKVFVKSNLTPASHRRRGYANLIDMIIFVGYMLLFSRSESMMGLSKAILGVLYPLVYLPVAYALGGTIGQRVFNLRIRQFGDYDKNISFIGGYKRIGLLITNFFTGVFIFSKERKYAYEKLSGSIMLELNISNNDRDVDAFNKKAGLIKGIITCLIYTAWVTWVQNYWLLLGNIVVFDIYVSKKVPWDFWKRTKEGKKPKAWIEWADALVFALVAVYFINLFLFQNYKIPTSSLEKSLLVGDHLFVSKVSYGPRIPNTPLSFPLLQNTVPGLNTKSYLEWPQWDYKRLKGFGSVENGDIVVFNFPTGDTVPVKSVNPDIYEQSRRIGVSRSYTDKSLMNGLENASEWEKLNRYRELGKEYIMLNSEDYGEVVYRPVDRRDNYVKRCVAIAGETLEIRHNQIYINGKAVENPEGLQHFYHVLTDGTAMNSRFLDKMEISNEDAGRMSIAPGRYIIPLTEEKAEMMKTYPFIRQIQMDEEKVDSTGAVQAWPYSKDYLWSRDNYGPLYVPKKGATVDLDMKNLVLYDRIITAYEGNKLEVKDNQIFINGEKATDYTFKMDYYFMMGDNRHQSADSRYWGFVPEDHVVGRPILVWLSLNKDKSWLGGKIRFDRFFKWVVNE